MESGIGASQAYLPKEEASAPQKEKTSPQKLKVKNKKTKLLSVDVGEKKPVAFVQNKSIPQGEEAPLTPPDEVVVPVANTNKEAPLKLPNKPLRIFPLQNREVDILFIVSGSPLMDFFLNYADQTFKGFTQALKPLNFEILFIDSYQTDNDFFAVNMRHKNEFAIHRESFDRSFRPEKRLTKNTPLLERVFINTLRIPRQTSWHRINQRTHHSPCPSDPVCRRNLKEQALKILQMSFQKNHFRKKAAVVAVIVTDLRNGDEEDLKRDVPLVRAEDLLSHFDSFYEGEKDMIVYTISLVAEDSQCLGKVRRALKKESAYASELKSLVQKTGGKNYSLCAKSYVPLARQMVFDLQGPGD